MPTSLAASTTRVPAGTAILWPSMVTFTSGIYGYRSDIARVPKGVVLVLLAEVAEGRVDDPPGGVAETAEASTVLQYVGDALEDTKLDLRALVRQDTVVGPDRPVAPDATRRALPARFVGIEAEQAGGRLDDAVRVVHHDDAARPAHRAGRGQRLHVGVRVEHGCGQDRRRRTARPEDLQVAALRRAAGQLHDHVAEGLSQLDLVHARLAHVAADRHDTGAGRLLGPELDVGGTPVVDDPGHGGEGLHVVEQGGPGPCPLDRGERRPGARLGALALERFEERSLLAADVGAVATVELDVEGIIHAHRLRPEVALRAGLADRLDQHPVRLVVFAPNVDPGLVGADRVGRDHDPLEDHMRRVLHDVAVLRGSRPRLVGVDEHVLGARAVAVDEAPPGGGVEASASAAAQACSLDLVGDVGRW